eukprot:356126-Chlamydomonas_euryale.AAC.3
MFASRNVGKLLADGDSWDIHHPAGSNWSDGDSIAMNMELPPCHHLSPHAHRIHATCVRSQYSCSGQTNTHTDTHGAPPTRTLCATPPR